MATYEVKTEGGTYQVDTEESPSVGGFAKNAWEDTKGNVVGLGHLAKGLVEHPIDTTVNTIKSLPGAISNEAKRIGVVGEGGLISSEAPFVHPANAAQKFGGAFYDKPLTTSLDVLPFVGAAGKALGIGGKAAEIGEVASEVAPLAEKMAPLAEDVSRISPKPSMSSPAPATMEEVIGKATPPPEAVSATPPPNDFLSDVKSKIPKEITDPMEQVNNYLKNQYGEAAKKPGMANTAADYLEEHSRNMNLKELGAAPGQVRKIGVERAHALADYANENGLVGPKIGTRGREKLIESRLNDSGGAVGAFRKMAEDRGAVQDIGNLTNQIKSKLDQKYLTPGMYSGQKGTYIKALNELKKTNGTATELADKVTEMFKEAKNQNPLGKPTGPLADVARQVRAINHDAISKSLSPQEMALYEKSLEDFGALTQIREFVKRRSSTEAGGRLGPGAGISRAAVQKFLDSFGYRAEAKVAGKLADFIRKNPDIMTRPKDIFRQYIDEAAEAVHEMGDAAH